MIRQVYIDKDRIISIKVAAIKRKEFLDRSVVDEENISFIVEGYYEVIKELLTALMLLHGMRSKNHQCLIAFFAKYFPLYEKEAKFIARMCYLRNSLNYQGEQISTNFFEMNSRKIKEVISLLLGILNKN